MTAREEADGQLRPGRHRGRRDDDVHVPVRKPGGCHHLVETSRISSDAVAAAADGDLSRQVGVQAKQSWLARLAVDAHPSVT